MCIFCAITATSGIVYLRPEKIANESLNNVGGNVSEAKYTIIIYSNT